MKQRAPQPKQLSFSSYEYSPKKRLTDREKLLAEMEQLVPWVRLEAVIEPNDPTGGRVGRKLIGVPRMLQMYFLQQWFSLPDEAVDDAIFDSQAMREFVGIDLARESVSDATTLLNFRRLLCMKANIGVDADSLPVHSLHTAATDQSDMARTYEELRGEEAMVFADAGYIGMAKRGEVVQAQPEGKIRTDFECNVRNRRSTITKMFEGRLKTLIQILERVKAQVHARVEHPFHVVKDLFHFKKVRFKGLATNEAQLYSLFGLVNLVIAKNRLMVLVPRGTGAT